MSFLARLPPATSSLTKTPLRTFTTSAARANLAKMTIIGRLAGPPEATQTANGQTMYRYAIGTNSGPRDNQTTSWFNVAAFMGDQPSERQLEYMAGLEKGTQVFVEADSKMVNLPIPGDAEGRTRKALNLVQRNLQVLAKPRNSEASDAAAGTADGAYVEAS